MGNRFPSSRHTLVRAQIPNIAELFIDTKLAEGRRPNTLKAFRDTLERFYGSGAPEAPEELTSDDIVRFLAGLTQRSLKPATRQYYQRSLYTYLGWLYDRGVLQRDIRRGVKRIQIPYEPRREVTPQDMVRLLAAVMNPSPKKFGRVENQQRDAAMLNLLWDTGLRAGELVGLDREHVDYKNLELFVPAHLTKTQRFRLVAFTQGTKLALREYDEVRTPWEESRGPEPLFRNRHGDRLQYEGLYRTIARISARAHVEFSPHDWRRGLAVELRRRDVSLETRMATLGHQTATMARYYSAAGDMEAAMKEVRAKRG